MSQRKAFCVSMLRYFLISALVPFGLFAYNGSETWLHYTLVDNPTMKSQYQEVCKSLVLSDANSDTLKNAQAEFDIAIPALLGGSKLAIADGPGAIVLAPQRSDLVTAANIDFSKINEEGFIIKSTGGKTYITGISEVGVLRGVYHFLRLMQTGRSLNNLYVSESPYFPYRVLDHWLNHYSSSPETERVYGGGRPFKMENFGKLSDNERKRVIDYCRMAVSVGLNGVCPDNVNTARSGINNWACLQVSNLKTQKVFADLIGTYGLKYYLSVAFASPQKVSPTTSDRKYDPRLPNVEQWWKDRVDTVDVYIKNFGGFLMKADSEGEDGPYTSLGGTQSMGANPLARALQRKGHVLIWRTFIYRKASDGTDFVNDQTEFFKDQTWEPGVILRMKDGPRDFQTVEPPHHLLKMKEVRKGMEFQITQEYTGQAIHLCWLVPKWKQILDYDMKVEVSPGTAGSVTHQILRGTGKASDGGGVWAISNFSDTINWTGQFLAQANSYGWGRLAWNPFLTQEQIADEWIKCSFDGSSNYGIQRVVYDMLRTSWKTYEDYTISYAALMPALWQNTHYDINFLKMNTIEFFTKYFMDLRSDGIGVDRTVATGNKAVTNYSSELQTLFGNRETCPEEYILFFHHLPWEYKMKSAMTLIQSLHHNHFRGIKQIQKNIYAWDLLKENTSLDADIHKHVQAKLKKQLSDGTTWANQFRSDFGTYYKTAVPCDISIVAPNPAKAVTTDVGTPVSLSATLKDQFGKAVSGSFKWSVDLPTGSLSAEAGETVSFTGSADGVYKVRLSHSEIPAMADEMQVFVGKWYEVPPPYATGVHRTTKSLRLPPFSMQQCPGKLVISSQAGGQIYLVNLMGGVLKSVNLKPASTISLETANIARGLYIFKFKNNQQIIQHKVLLK